jgi:hypothetical protein
VRPKAPAQPRNLDLGRNPREKDEKHLNKIRQLPCLLTGFTYNVHAAHVRYADPERGKRQVGMGEKPDDKWAVPLVQDLHVLQPGAQHNHNERDWWEYFGTDPLRVAELLWKYNHDPQAMYEVVTAFRPEDATTKHRIEMALQGIPLKLGGLNS